MHPYLEASATELARRVRAREVSPRELVEVHIDRIREVNGLLNAVVLPCFDRARAMAVAAEERVAAHRPGHGADLPPLLGVPCTLKETFAVEGQPWTAGIVARRDVRADRNATAVQRLLDAGAIPLGITNVPEAAMWYETDNRIYGRSSNPHDTRRTPGGSSGGEAAIIGAGGSPFGLGSDIGGSIRMPAAFCGIAGHKPSPGLVPSTGQIPEPHPAVRRFAVAGPLARRAEDLELLLEILSGPDGEDGTVEHGFARAELPAPGARRAFYMEDGPLPSTPMARQAVRKVVDALRRNGFEVSPWRPPHLDRAVLIWLGALEEIDQPSFASILGDGPAIRPLREMLRLPFGASPHTLPALGLAALEALGDSLPGGLARHAALRHELRVAIEERLGADGVLVAPAFPRGAPRHGEALRRPFEWITTGIFNVAELPVTCVPAIRDERDLPLGVQIVAGGGRDALTLAVAKLVERELGGWRPGRGLHAV